MTANQNPAEQRRSPRLEIAEPPAVHNAHSGEALGQLVNLSSDGLMVTSEQPLGCGSVCQLRIALVTGDEQVEICIGCESLWSEDVHGSGVYWTSFHIIDVSARDQAIIDAVVAG